jgi:DNA-binding MarR family transcriptional regulator
MIHILSVMEKPFRDNQTPHSAKELSRLTKISYKGVRNIIARMKEREFVEYGKDHEGRMAWIITSKGDQALWNILDRRVRNTYRAIKKNYEHEAILIVEKVNTIFKELKAAGWHDLQIRNIIYRVNVHKIERIIRFSKKRAKKNLGGYLWSVLTNKHSFNTRLAMYARHENFDMTIMADDIKKTMVEAAKGMTSPFKGFKFMYNRAVKESVMTDGPEWTDLYYKMSTVEKALKYKKHKDYAFQYVS